MATGLPAAFSWPFIRRREGENKQKEAGRVALPALRFMGRRAGHSTMTLAPTRTFS